MGESEPPGNRYSGITRSSKAQSNATGDINKSTAEGKAGRGSVKLPTRKRKLNEPTQMQSPMSSIKPPGKPQAPPKPSKPGAMSIVPSYGSYGKIENADHASSPPKKQKTDSPSKKKDEEKRLRVFRKKAPLSYLEKLQRATSQRMFVIDRSRGGTEDVPEETIDMAGTTGNIYSITIAQLPNCTCPDNQKGNQCKHIVYVRQI